MMGKILRISLIFLISAAVFLYLVYLQLPDIAVGMLGKAYGLKIAYKHADIKPRLVNKVILIDFNLKDVTISRNIESAPAKDSYNSVSDLVAAPFNGDWTYQRVSGTVRPSREKLEIIALNAEAKEFKISAKGSASYETKSADMDIVLSFSGSLISRIPGELSGTILKDEQGGWKSLSVNIKGNLSSPSISITGKMFRLNIRELS